MNHMNAVTNAPAIRRNNIVAFIVCEPRLEILRGVLVWRSSSGRPPMSKSILPALTTLLCSSKASVGVVFVGTGPSTIFTSVRSRYCCRCASFRNCPITTAPATGPVSSERSTARELTIIGPYFDCTKPAVRSAVASCLDNAVTSAAFGSNAPSVSSSTALPSARYCPHRNCPSAA
jgi:hypothetical protein